MTTTIKKSNKAAEEAINNAGFAALGSVVTENYKLPLELVSWEVALNHAIEAWETGNERLGRDASKRMHFAGQRNWMEFGILIDKPTLSEDAVYFEIRSDLYDPTAEEQVDGAVRRCKLLDKRGNSYSPLLAMLTKAYVVAEANNQAVILMTSAYGKWTNGRWFDSAIVVIK